MKEYIERGAVEQFITDGLNNPDKQNAYGHDAVEILTHVTFLPAADVEEVRHGRWIEDGYYNEPCVCSFCGEPCKDTVMGRPMWNYCSNCGAKMDGGVGK